MKTLITCAAIAMLVSCLVTGCGSPNESGKLVGIQTSFALDDALDDGTAQESEDTFVIQGVVLDAEGAPLSRKKLTLYRNTSSAPPPKKMGMGGVEAPWRGPEAPANLYMEFEETTELKSPMPGLPKTPVMHVFNPSAETDQSGQFKLEVESSFLGDAKDCTLTVSLPRPGGGITPTQIPQRGEDPLVFECPSSANSEIDLGELRVE